MKQCQNKKELGNLSARREKVEGTGRSDARIWVVNSSAGGVEREARRRTCQLLDIDSIGWANNSTKPSNHGEAGTLVGMSCSVSWTRMEEWMLVWGRNVLDILELSWDVSC